MSKAFTKESDDSPDDELDPSSWADLPLTAKNYVTPGGYQRLVAERDHLLERKKPEVTAQISAAAARGATSENLDYHLGKRRLREIDRRLNYLAKRIEHASVIDPAKRARTDQAFFGATVTYVNPKGDQRTVSIVGVDEADVSRGYVSFVSPIARVLLQNRAGDVVTFQAPAGAEELEIVDVKYRDVPTPPFEPE